MLSKKQLKLIASLQQKKYRNKNNLFIVEGVKGVNEFLNSNFELFQLFCTEQFEHDLHHDKVSLVNETELRKISNYSTPNEVLALFVIPERKEIVFNEFTVVLDGINDPGNLGTIIRLCDWFNVKQLICSNDTVDCYNSKVIQSTMGSLSRVSIIYSELSEFISETQLPIFSTLLEGDNVYESTLPAKAILVMGNEANGVSESINNLIKNKLTIPRFGESISAESLNVATATAILLSEFRRS